MVAPPEGSQSVKRARIPLDVDAGIVVGLGAAVYVATVGGIRGVAPDRISGLELLLMVVGFGVFAFAVAAVIAGRPDFGPTRRAALVRGFVAALPFYAAGGLVFVSPEQWLSLLPFFSIGPALLVGPPIGIFMYRLYRRADRRGTGASIFRVSGEAAAGPEMSSDDPSVQLAWQKGELVGSWTPLLVTIALFASFGLGTLAIEMADLELRGLRPRPTVSTHVLDRLPALYEAVRADSQDARARFELGSVLASFGRFDEAVMQLGDAVRLDSTQAEHWRMLGRAAFYARRSELALVAYWNAQRLDPETVRARGLDWVIWHTLLNPEG